MSHYSKELYELNFNEFDKYHTEKLEASIKNLNKEIPKRLSEGKQDVFMLPFFIAHMVISNILDERRNNGS